MSSVAALIRTGSIHFSQEHQENDTVEVYVTIEVYATTTLSQSKE
jgi:hypothetical protein